MCSLIVMAALLLLCVIDKLRKVNNYHSAACLSVIFSAAAAVWTWKSTPAGWPAADATVITSRYKHSATPLRYWWVEDGGSGGIWDPVYLKEEFWGKCKCVDEMTSARMHAVWPGADGCD